MAMDHLKARPFLKWVGGKTQILPQIAALVPENVERYFEPFLGGGAVFFHLKHRFPYLRAHLRDQNAELINAFVAVRDCPEGLMRRLDEHLADFLNDRENYYYAVRRQQHLPGAAVVERAARMIFLNKTCFNGLWRVNSRGEFNVPIGSQSQPNLYDRANILAASLALAGVNLAVQDFRETMQEVRPGDFVYLDPPYVPRSATANFTAYTREGFGLAEQRDLAAHFVTAHRCGAQLLLSNSDTPEVRRWFRRFNIRRVRARRAINCKGGRRGRVNEVVVRTSKNQAAVSQFSSN